MNKRFLRLKLSGKGYAVDQRVRHFPERGLNGLLIIRHSYLLVGFGNTQVGDVPPTLEDRQADLRQESPDARTAVKEMGQLVRGRADVRGQRNAGEEIRPRRADVRVGGLERMLGLKDVRALEEHRGGQAHRNIRPDRKLGERLGGQHIRCHFRTREQAERRDILGHLPAVTGNVHPRRIHAGLRLAQIQLGRNAHGMAPRDHFV